MRVEFTDKFIRSRRPNGSRQEYCDTIVPQLMLRIGERGAKSWALLARYPGYRNPTRRTLGPVFPGDRQTAFDPDIYNRHGAALTLAEAREKARCWLGLIARKIDPAAEREAQTATRPRNEVALPAPL
jgi:hypothetical protein